MPAYWDMTGQPNNAYSVLKTGMDSGYNFSPYQGTYALTGDKYAGDLQGGAAMYNQATGQNLTAAQYDAMINPTTYGSMYGADGSRVTGQATESDPNKIMGTNGTPVYGGIPGVPSFANGGGMNTSQQPMGGFMGGGGGRGGRHAMMAQAPAAAPAVTPASLPADGFLGFNPALVSQIGNLGQQYAQQFQRNVLPAIDSRAIMAGGYGGSKQGIAEGIAAGDSMNGFIRSATDLLGRDWTDQQARNLTQQGQQLNFASDQRAQDRADLLAGAGLYDQGTSGYWKPLQAANSIYGNYTGFGNTTNSSNQGGGLQGALGGAGVGYQLAKGWLG
jgi:hypothetical protein